MSSNRKFRSELSDGKHGNRSIESTTKSSETIEEFDARTGQVIKRVSRTKSKDSRIIEYGEFPDSQNAKMGYQTSPNPLLDHFVANRIIVSLGRESEPRKDDWQSILGDHELEIAHCEDNQWIWTCSTIVEGQNLSLNVQAEIINESEAEVTFNLDGIEDSPTWIGIVKLGIDNYATLHQVPSFDSPDGMESIWPKIAKVTSITQIHSPEKKTITTSL